MKKKLILMMSMLLWLGLFSACSSDEGNTDSIMGKNKIASEFSIVGTWELKTLCYPENVFEIPIDQRDVFIFSSNDKIKVFIKKGKPLYPDLPNEDGEYDYFYDKEKQEIQLCEKTLKCITSESEMHMEGYHYGPDDGLYVHEYIFIKK